MDNRSYQVTIKGLCFDAERRLLLLREPSGFWNLPGGRMEHGEDFHTTLRRECREEIGIDCEILDATPHLDVDVDVDVDGKKLRRSVEGRAVFPDLLPHLNILRGKAVDTCLCILLIL